MKRVFRLLLVTFSAVLMIACSPEERKDLVNQIIANDSQKTDGDDSGADGENPSGEGEKPTTLTGTYALYDGTGLTTRYLSFSNGNFYDFHLKESLNAVVNAEGYLWHCSFVDFESVNSGDFSIQDGQLICAGVPYGAITVKTDEITLEREKFTRFSSFKSPWYTTLTITGNKESYSYSQQVVEWTVSLDKTIPASIPVAVTDNDWINDVAITDGKLRLFLSENNTGNPRKGNIVVHCPGSESKTISFTQNYSAPEITFTPATQKCDYAGGTFIFSFFVSNSRNATTIIAQSSDAWITDVTLEGNSVSYKVAENNTGSSRTGTIRLAYGSYTTKNFTVSQTYEDSEISCTPISQECNYTAGSFNFDFSLSNPRNDATVTAQSQNGWITDVSLEGNSVSYKVAENNTGSSRTGTIRLVYSTFATFDFSVNQNPMPTDPTVANCYIISSAGTYQFKTVYGNSTVTIKGIFSVEVLWESFGTSTTPSKGDIIKTAAYQAGSGSIPGIITFSTPSTLKNGNAVIAAKDASGNTLWSWHIWVCKDYDPNATAQAYFNTAGMMMDRNLGATSATPGDVGALGLLYQWGRKDPFLGSSSISSNITAASTLSWPTPVSSDESIGTISYVVAHPTTFITKNSSNYDWYYTGSSDIDNTLWRYSKTIYDPCPPGWRVSGGDRSDVWRQATGRYSSFSYPFDNTKKGMNFSGKFGSADTIWYPAAGSIDFSGGNIINCGYWGRCWSCTTTNAAACILDFSLGSVSTSWPSNATASGYSVRCQKE